MNKREWRSTGDRLLNKKDRECSKNTLQNSWVSYPRWVFSLARARRCSFTPYFLYPHFMAVFALLRIREKRMFLNVLCFSSVTRVFRPCSETRETFGCSQLFTITFKVPLAFE